MKKFPHCRKLKSGVEIPVLGLGVYKMPPGEVTEHAVLWALEAGYRHVDTAARYGNEESVGNAIRKSSIPREEVFVTTKLWNDDQDNPRKALKRSLKRLGFEYVDLYLVHWPVEGKRIRTWKMMEEIYHGGLARAIGVSNFTTRHLDGLLEHATVVPDVNQVEFNPFLYQKELLEYCTSHGIALEAYSPLTRGSKMDHPLIVETGEKYKKSSAQIFIRWALQHGLVVIPKSSHKERIRENADVFDFEISDDDMKKLDGLDEGFRMAPNPEDIA